MDDRPGHELIDLGEERRLERFADRVVDRPAPGEGGFPRRDPSAWAQADARFERDPAGNGSWVTVDPAATPWRMELAGLAFELRLAPSGQVGCFPEQAASWRWIEARTGALAAGRVETLAATAGPIERPGGRGSGPEILNLFAHTGGSTLAAARAGGSVVHLDGSRPAIAWARRNAAINGLAEAPIRWIVDEAGAFVRREARRGRRYAGIVLDPPSFGHGADGRPWRLEDDLPALLAACAALVAVGPAYVVLSAHTPGFGPDRLSEALRDALGPGAAGKVDADELELVARSGRRLGLGAVARWSR